MNGWKYNIHIIHQIDRISLKGAKYNIANERLLFNNKINFENGEELVEIKIANNA